ncbi:Thiamin pyrophosphokinase [Syncephalastrum racemosum]|uniref:Thiamine pyrophosphokinase n=1 Tax=Syncephalastrum racemosum TaxID=13706 RepID=A0A1X2HJX1_SYNRA|nr:Thiamin pyrophosphokinase [Syncephalastrum racemosum]
MNGFKIISHWCPSNILAREYKAKKFCLIILNQPIVQKETFQRLWANAAFRFCADGGSNRLYDAFKHDQHKLDLYVPDQIAGDLDSIRDEVREFYEDKNVIITKDADQYKMDFTKCIDRLKLKEEELGQTFDIVAFPSLGGRFDQTMQNINMLYMMKDQIERRMVLVSDENLTILLDKGSHHIHCQPEYEGPTCGYIPVGAPATVTTRGLRWDLEKHLCEFGGLVSSSNALDGDLVEIETDSPIVWTIEIKNNEL